MGVQQIFGHRPRRTPQATTATSTNIAQPYSCRLANAPHTQRREAGIWCQPQTNLNDNNVGDSNAGTTPYAYTTNTTDTTANEANNTEPTTTAASTLNQSYRCLLEQFDAAVQRAHYKCQPKAEYSATGATVVAENDLDEGFAATMAEEQATGRVDMDDVNCVINTEVIVQQLRQPVVNFNLALARQQTLQGEHISHLVDSINISDTSSAQCKIEQRQLLYCDESAAADISRLAHTDVAMASTIDKADFITNSGGNTSIVDDFICYLRIQYEDLTARLTPPPTNQTTPVTAALDGLLLPNFTDSLSASADFGRNPVSSAWQQFISSSRSRWNASDLLPQLGVQLVNSTANYSWLAGAYDDSLWSWNVFDELNIDNESAPAIFNSSNTADTDSSSLASLWGPRNLSNDYSLSNKLTRQHDYEWIFLCVIFFIFAGGVGNILVCLAVARDKKLQNVTNYFLFSLAIADLLVSLFVMPLGAIPAFLGKCF